MGENVDARHLRRMLAPHSANSSYAIFMAEILRRANGSTETDSSACAKAGFDANHLRADSTRWARLEPDRSESMSDEYYSAIQEQWSNIRGLYMAYGSKKPIMLYDIRLKQN